MLLTLSKLENHHNYEFDLRKASEKLGKAFSEAEIRSFVENLLQKSDAEMYVTYYCFSLCLLIGRYVLTSFY